MTDASNNYVTPPQCFGCAVIGGEYTPEGNPHHIYLGRTATTAHIFTYDFYNSRLQRITSQVCCDSQGHNILYRFYDFRLSSGDNGNIASVGIDSNRTQNFFYDPLNRITQAYTNGPNWGEHSRLMLGATCGVGLA